jgi:hypothetical protein
MARPVGRPRGPGRPRTNNNSEKLGFTLGRELMARFDALRDKKGKKLGIQLSPSPLMALILRKKRKSNEL